MKAGLAGLSGPLALVLLLPMEAGVPIPVPADLVMFTVGNGLAGLAAPDPVRTNQVTSRRSW
jgi:hypothetical protein